MKQPIMTQQQREGLLAGTHRISDDGEKVVEKALELECESGFNKEVWSIPAEQVGGVGALKNLYVAAVFEGDGKRVKSTALFVKENKVKLPRANVSAEVTEVGDGFARIFY